MIIGINYDVFIIMYHLYIMRFNNTLSYVVVVKVILLFNVSCVVNNS